MTIDVTTDLEQRVTARKAAREAVEQIVLLVAGEHRALVEAHGQVASEAFWENFREAFIGHFPKPPAAPAIKPMDDFEAKAFGQRTISFGQHKGRRFDDVERGYLEWLAYNEDDLKAEARRYLLSDRVRRERCGQDEQGDDE